MKTTAIKGEVTGVNEKGVKLGDTWYNYSKFAENLEKLTEAQVGASVELALDKANYIRAVRVLKNSQTPAASQSIAKWNTFRITALQCATQLIASHPQTETSDLTESLAIETLSLANALLQWLKENEDE